MSKPIYLEGLKNLLPDLEKAHKKGKEITTIQIHHSYIPNYQDCENCFNKHKSLKPILDGIYTYHAKTMSWGDIGYNLIVTPKGTMWKGREFYIDPYGIAGANRKSFAICFLGNFDKGNDIINNSQLLMGVEAIRLICETFSLNPNTCLVYHNEKATKSCPGTNFTPKSKLIELIEANV